MTSSFAEDLKDLINKHGLENGSNTPDFLLARYLCMCLDAFDQTIENRRKWHVRDEADPQLKSLSSDVPSRE